MYRSRQDLINGEGLYDLGLMPYQLLYQTHAEVKHDKDHFGGRISAPEYQKAFNAHTKKEYHRFFVVKFDLDRKEFHVAMDFKFPRL